MLWDITKFYVCAKEDIVEKYVCLVGVILTVVKYRFSTRSDVSLVKN